MALPTALFAMIASFALASAAVLSSVDAQQGAKRDHGSKESIAAADAGANLALLRLNRFMPSLSVKNPCVGPSGESLLASGGWCPTSPTQTVGNGAFSYRVSAYDGTGNLRIVSVGTASGVSRRVEVGLKSVSGKNVFLGDQLIGQNGILVSGNAKIETNLGTNASVTTKGGSYSICGNVRVGPGMAETPPKIECNGKLSEGSENLPPIVLPANIATENDDYRLVKCKTEKEPKTPTGCQSDTYSKKWAETVPWNPTTRTISVSNGQLSLGGKDYFICQLFIESGELIMVSDVHVRIFFDTPEHCGLKAGEYQIKMGGNSKISSTAYNPSQGTFDVPGFYVLGSPTIPTKIELNGSSGATNELMLYAPNSDVTITGNAAWLGMFAGKTMTVEGSATVKADPRIPQPEITLAGLFARNRYVECTGATASPPDASC